MTTLDLHREVSISFENNDFDSDEGIVPEETTNLTTYLDFNAQDGISEKVDIWLRFFPSTKDKNLNNSIIRIASCDRNELRNILLKAAAALK